MVRVDRIGRDAYQIKYRNKTLETLVSELEAIRVLAEFFILPGMKESERNKLLGEIQTGFTDLIRKDDDWVEFGVNHIYTITGKHEEFLKWQ